jgi:hypothetical protein
MRKRKDPAEPERDPDVRRDRGDDEPAGGSRPTQRDRDMDTPQPGSRDRDEEDEE